MSSSCRFPILTPVARVTAACASSIEPLAASTAVSLRSPWECFSSGKFSAASAGGTFGRPGDRDAIRGARRPPSGGPVRSPAAPPANTVPPPLGRSRHVQPVLEQPPQQLPAPHVQLLLQVSVLQPRRLLRHQPVLQLAEALP